MFNRCFSATNNDNNSDWVTLSDYSTGTFHKLAAIQIEIMQALGKFDHQSRQILSAWRPEACSRYKQ